jgi:glycosyltransferase involved in cell wall biosynthesis
LTIAGDSAPHQVLLSVVVPTLQEEKLLERTLLVFDREWRQANSAELIVSDGGSTDGTLEIAKRHANVVVLHSGDHRQTIAEGRNSGAAVARGKVIVFINGDTVPADKDVFTRVIVDLAMRRGPYGRASALACPVRFAPHEEGLGDVLFLGFYNNLARLLCLIRVGSGRGECQVVRRDVFNAVGGYKKHLVAGEDFELLGRIGMMARVQYAPELVVFESPRRFRKFGYLRTIRSWIGNGLSVIFRGRSSSDEWEPVR